MMINRRGFAVIVTMLGIWGLLVYKVPENSDSVYGSLYVILLIGCLIFTIIVGFVLSRDAYVFEPIVLVLVLYYFIFFIRPCYDIIVNGGFYSSSGKDMSAGCVKATVLVLIGTVALIVGYYSKGSVGFLARKEYFTDEIIDTNALYQKALVIWIISAVLSFVYFIGSGFSLTYVLTAGVNGSTSDVIEGGTLTVFSVFKSCLITSGLYIYIFGRSRIVKLVVYFVGLMIFISMGGRALTIVYIMTPIIYMYISRKKTIRLTTMMIVVGVLVILCVMMEATRTGIRSGAGFTLPEFSVELIMSPFDHELTTYKAFYGVVDAIPQNANYCYGKGIFLYTLVMMIPRALWPGKPSPPIYDVIRAAIDETAVAGGAVYPNIGEFYVEFGIVGVIVLMFIFGKYLQHLDNLRVYGEQKSHALILYSAEYALLLQVIIRGYTPSNFYQVLLAAVPVFLLGGVFSKRNG